MFKVNIKDTRICPNIPKTNDMAFKEYRRQHEHEYLLNKVNCKGLKL